jgi:hypothetical protein
MSNATYTGAKIMRTSVHYPSPFDGNPTTRTFRSAYDAWVWIDTVPTITSVDYYYTATNFVTLTRRELSDIQESNITCTYISGIPAHLLPLTQEQPSCAHQ